MRYLDVACRALVASVFIVAVTSKISRSSAWLGFVQSLHDLRRVPDAAVRLVAVATVAVEGLVVVLLLVPARAPGAVGFVLAACLLGAFTVVIGLALAEGNRAPCRCFGASRTPLGVAHVARNIALIGVAALGVSGLFAEGAVSPLAAVLAGITGMVLGVLITAAEDVIALIKPIQ